MQTRRNAGRAVIAALVLLGCITAGALLAHVAVAQTRSCTVTANRLNVRARPGTTYAIVGQMARNTRFTPTARTADAGWLFGSSQRANGWASAPYLTCSFDITTLPVNASLVGQVAGGSGGTPIVPPTTTPMPSVTPYGQPPSASTPVPLTWLYIPEGPFVMGSTEADIWAAVESCNQWEGGCRFDWFDRELPQRTVTLPAFTISMYEITNGQYQECVSAGYCRDVAPQSTDGTQSWQSSYSGVNYPRVGISYSNASRFCAWVGGALPSEAQWEKAARGTGALIYPWGNVLLADRANLYRSMLAPVGSYPAGASPYGVHDMAGNAFEWTSSTYNGSYVLRGGSWASYPFRGRTADRGTALSPTFANYDIGFRCVR